VAPELLGALSANDWDSPSGRAYRRLEDTSIGAEFPPVLGRASTRTAAPNARAPPSDSAEARPNGMSLHVRRRLRR